jgi:hypothetical protein
MSNLLRVVYKWIVKRQITMSKYKALYNLESDLSFLQSQHDKVFKLSEEEMRNRMQELEFKKKKSSISDEELKEYEELPRTINKYDSIKGIFGKTQDEITLVKSYINFLENKKND